MRETIGTSWVYGLALTFTLLFSGFLVLIINYSQVFIYKNDVVEILEKYEGYTETSQTIINNYLSTSGYKTKGSCPEGYYGATDLEGSGNTNSSGTYYYCLKLDGTKYDVILFYKFNLPVIGDIITFQIGGETNNMIISKDTGSYIV